MTENKVRGEVRVTLAGVEIVLVPSFQRLAKVEAALGYSIVKFIRRASEEQDASLADVVTIIELLTRAPKLRTEAIGELVVRAGLIQVMPIVTDALTRALTGDPEDDGDGADEGKGAGEPSAA